MSCRTRKGARRALGAYPDSKRIAASLRARGGWRSRRVPKNRFANLVRVSRPEKTIRQTGTPADRLSPGSRKQVGNGTRSSRGKKNPRGPLTRAGAQFHCRKQGGPIDMAHGERILLAMRFRRGPIRFGLQVEGRRSRTKTHPNTAPPPSGNKAGPGMPVTETF